MALFDVRGLITWHVALGALLVPPALLKTESTCWRVVRYYRGHPAYAEAGPPPMLLRLLGPLVVLGTVVLLGTGVTTRLVGDGPAGRFSVLGVGADWRGVDGASFWFWAAITGLHLLGRIGPALLIAFRTDARIPRRPRRLAALALTLVAAAVLGVVLVQSNRFESDDPGSHPRVGSHPVRNRSETTESRCRSGDPRDEYTPPETEKAARRRLHRWS